MAGKNLTGTQQCGFLMNVPICWYHYKCLEVLSPAWALLNYLLRSAPHPDSDIHSSWEHTQQALALREQKPRDGSTTNELQVIDSMRIISVGQIRYNQNCSKWSFTYICKTMQWPSRKGRVESLTLFITCKNQRLSFVIVIERQLDLRSPLWQIICWSGLEQVVSPLTCHKLLMVYRLSFKSHFIICKINR